MATCINLFRVRIILHHWPSTLNAKLINSNNVDDDWIVAWAKKKETKMIIIIFRAAVPKQGNFRWTQEKAIRSSAWNQLSFATLRRTLSSFSHFLGRHDWNEFHKMCCTVLNWTSRLDEQFLVGCCRHHKYFDEAHGYLFLHDDDDIEEKLSTFNKRHETTHSILAKYSILISSRRSSNEQGPKNYNKKMVQKK